jgi:hypothetical protein
MGSGVLTTQLRSILLDLARREDECAAVEAAAQPYWMVCPPSVQGHRAAAVALRQRADELASVVRTAVSRLGGDGK